jgi:hypothetical protein
MLGLLELGVGAMDAGQVADLGCVHDDLRREFRPQAAIEAVLFGTALHLYDPGFHNASPFPAGSRKLSTTQSASSTVMDAPIGSVMMRSAISSVQERRMGAAQS